MANWIKQPCLEILNKINKIPEGDQREAKQLAILMDGLADINKEMMRRAAEAARAQFSELAEESKAPSAKKPAASEEKSTMQEALDDTPDLDDFDSFDEELDMIEQTLIRSIGD